MGGIGDTTEVVKSVTNLLLDQQAGRREEREARAAREEEEKSKKIEKCVTPGKLSMGEAVYNTDDVKNWPPHMVALQTAKKDQRCSIADTAAKANLRAVGEQMCRHPV